MSRATLNRITILCVTVLLASTPAMAREVRIGWTAWSDAEFVTKLAQRILENRMDQDVELVQTDIAPQYQGVASGSIDVMLMSWLPDSQADYMKEVQGDVANLGVLYDHAKLGWVVPEYVPREELDSIEDLRQASVREKLGGRITGIDPGAGLTRLSKKAIDEYGLDGYTLQTSSGAAMTAALERAVQEEEWIVVTGWSPHWKFGAWDLRYLDDPDGVIGDFQRVHAIAREDFYQDNIDAAMMLSRMWIPIDDLQGAMYDARQESYEAAVTTYIENNEERIEYWVSGSM